MNLLWQLDVAPHFLVSVINAAISPGREQRSEPRVKPAVGRDGAVVQHYTTVSWEQNSRQGSPRARRRKKPVCLQQSHRKSSAKTLTPWHENYSPEALKITSPEALELSVNYIKRNGWRGLRVSPASSTFPRCPAIYSQGQLEANKDAVRRENSVVASKRGRACVFSVSANSQQKHPGRLGIWQLITPKSAVYEKDAKLCVDSPPGLWFAIRYEFIEALRKTCEKKTAFTYFPRSFSQFSLHRKSETGC